MKEMMKKEKNKYLNYLKFAKKDSLKESRGFFEKSFLKHK